MNSSLKLIFDSAEQTVYWYMNINEEQQWNYTKVFPSMKDEIQNQLVKQQEQQLFFIARPSDYVFVRHEPDPAFISYLTKQGYVIPRLLRIPDNEKIPWNKMQRSHASVFAPYIVVENLSKEAEEHNVSLFGGSAELVKMLNSKIYTRRLAESHCFKVTSGEQCHSVEELQRVYAELTKRGFEKVVLKIPYGSSGKGLKIIDNASAFAGMLSFIARRGSSFEMLLEGWHTIKRSLNAQLLIHDGDVFVMAITEQKIDQDGMYIGTDYIPHFEESIIREYKSEITRIGMILSDMGYEGILGIDSIIDTNDEIFPIIEINARFTQVTYMMPVVSKLSATYNYIESRFARFSSESKGFDEIFERLKSSLCPDNENDFLIYTFARTTVGGKNTFRVFVLFYGKERDKVSEMIDKWDQIGSEL